MPNLNATATISLQYTPPGGAVNSGLLSYAVTATCAAQNVGQIDVVNTASPGDEIEIPFGSVGDAKIFVLKNLSSNDYGVKLNGSASVNFSVAANGEFAYAVNAVPGADTLTGVTLVVSSTPTNTDFLQYFVFGD